MRDPKRIDEILKELGKLWKEHPDLRLGQLIMAVTGEKAHIGDIFHIEDKEMLLQIRKTRVRLGK